APPWLSFAGSRHTRPTLRRSSGHLRQGQTRWLRRLQNKPPLRPATEQGRPATVSELDNSPRHIAPADQIADSQLGSLDRLDELHALPPLCIYTVGSGEPHVKRFAQDARP